MYSEEDGDEEYAILGWKGGPEKVPFRSMYLRVHLGAAGGGDGKRLGGLGLVDVEGAV